jgi:lipoate synthase
MMATKKHPVPAYLDEMEFERLTKIANEWGCSLSAALKRLIRESNAAKAVQSLPGD